MKKELEAWQLNQVLRKIIVSNYNIFGDENTMRRTLEKSKLKLVRDLQIKVNANNKTYYFNEKAYCSECDGYIDLTEITEEIFNMSKLLKMRTIEVDFENAQLHIQREIEKIREDKLNE